LAKLSLGGDNEWTAGFMNFLDEVDLYKQEAQIEK
jgi:hypothetical protein